MNQLDVFGQVKRRDFLRGLRDSNNNLIGVLDKDGNTIGMPQVAANVRTYGAIGNGTNNDYSAIASALAVLPSNAAYNDPRTLEGGIVYFPEGKYKINTALALGNGLGDGHRQGVHLKGAGINSTILYSDTLKTMISADSSVDNFMISDMSIICYAAFTGLGTVEKIVDLVDCLNFRMHRVKIYVRTPGVGNTDCVLLSLKNCYYSEIFACETISFISTAAEKHNISLASTALKFGSTHIRSENNNALYIKDHLFSNPYRGMHLINDDGGVSVHGGAIESYVQGFLFESSFGNTLENVRFETHPESYMQYLGDGVQYSVMFDEYSSWNRVHGYGYEVQSNLINQGFIDHSKMNHFKPDNRLRKNGIRSLIKNGDFAIPAYVNGAETLVPGWALNGTPTVVNETTDLPPDAVINRVLKITSAANLGGIKAPVTFDPERMPILAYKFWMKRLTGNHTLRCMLQDTASGSYFVTNAPLLHGAAMTQGKSGLPITSATWAAGVLTVNVGTPNHFCKLNQKITLSGFTSSGTSLNTSHTVASVVDADTYTLAVAADPGTISVIGTYARNGVEDVVDVATWQEYAGFKIMRRGITNVDLSGANCIITFNSSHGIPNSASANVKLFGLSNPNFNATHAVISATNNTVTIAKPAGAAPVQVGHGDFGVLPFYGWGGLVGAGQFVFGAEFGTASSTAEHLLGGIVVIPAMIAEITDSYPSAITRLSAAVTYNAPSVPALAAGSYTTTTVTVTGAAVGDAVTAGLSTANAGMKISGDVLSANTVTVKILNITAGAIDLASGLLTVFVDHLG